MITYSTFERNKIGLLTQKDLKESDVDYGVSVTDKTKYNPQASSFIANSGSISSRPLYHFKDGKDNGINMALFSNKNLDVTERQALLDKLNKKTAEEIDRLIELIDAEEQSDEKEDFQSSDKSASDSQQS